MFCVYLPLLGCAFNRNHAPPTPAACPQQLGVAVGLGYMRAPELGRLVVLVAGLGACVALN